MLYEHQLAISSPCGTPACPVSVDPLQGVSRDLEFVRSANFRARPDSPMHFEQGVLGAGMPRGHIRTFYSSAL